MPIRSDFSSSRPTSGVVCVRVTSRSEARARRERAKERERLCLALHLHRLELLVLEDALGRAVRLLRDGDAVDRRRRLEAGGGVDDVAGDDALALLRTGAERDDRLARVDPDPHLQRERRVFGVQLLDRLEDAEPRAHGTLGVVLVRDGRSEDGHHGVADELLDRPAVELDLLPQARVVGTDARADVLGVGGLRGGGEADEVAEEDGDDLALLVHGRRRLRGQRSGAKTAELEAVWVLLAAGRTGQHAPSLGRRPQGKKARFQSPSSPFLLSAAKLGLDQPRSVYRRIDVEACTELRALVLAAMRRCRSRSPPSRPGRGSRHSAAPPRLSVWPRTPGEGDRHEASCAPRSPRSPARAPPCSAPPRPRRRNSCRRVCDRLGNGEKRLLRTSRSARGSTRTGRAPIELQLPARSTSSCTSNSTASASSGTEPT